MPKRYYWLKMKKDFFKRHDIRILEGMEDGHEIVLVYIKMLCESLDHDGNLRFSDDLPYTDEMMACVLGCSRQIMERSMEMFQKIGFVSVLDDGTIHMNHLEQMLGCETEWAAKKRTYRGHCEDKPRTDEGHTEDIVRTLSDKRIENRDKSIENRDKSIEDSTNIPDSSILLREREEKEERENGADAPSLPKTKSRFVPPTVEEVRMYCLERKNDVDAERFVSYYQANGWKVGRNSMKDWKAAVRTWEKRAKEVPIHSGGKKDVPYMEKTYPDGYFKEKERRDVEDLLNDD